jgi:hypothetical protein
MPTSPQVTWSTRRSFALPWMKTRFDESEIAGLRPTTPSPDLRRLSPAEVVERIVPKLETERRGPAQGASCVELGARRAR